MVEAAISEQRQAIIDELKAFAQTHMDAWDSYAD